jgi:excisionase family DNA binding protein
MDREMRDAMLEVGKFFAMANEWLARFQAQQPPGADDPMPRFITRQEAARMLDVSCRTIDRYIRQGRLQKRELGQSVRVLASDVEALVK